jgi:hypothetical protein
VNTWQRPEPELPAEPAGISYPGQPYPAQWLQPNYPAPWDQQPTPQPVAAPVRPVSRQTEFSAPDLFKTNPYTPFPDPFAPAQRTAAGRRSRGTGPVIALVVLVLLAGSAFAFVIASSHRVARSAGPIASTTIPSIPIPSTPTPTFTGGDHFTLPPTVIGLPRSTNPSLIDDATSAVAAIGGTGAGPSVVGAYQSRTDPDDAYLLIGVPMRVVDARTAAVGALEDLAANDDFVISPEKTYSTGTRGAVMICATAISHAMTIPWPSSICVVADSGGLIIAMYISHSGAADATATKSIRTAFEQ